LAELHHAITEQEGRTLLTVGGEIDMSNARDMRKLLLQTLEHAERLALDLRDVASMDSSGIAALIETLTRATAIGKSFRVTGVNERVRLALKLLCIERLLVDD
jgi:anti-sigma B factor antagonist